MSLVSSAKSHKSRVIHLFFNLYYFLKDFMYLFLEKGEGREKERERNISVWLPLTRSKLGTGYATQAHVLTGNRTSNPLVCRPALKPLSHSSQGSFLKKSSPEDMFTDILEREEGGKRERAKCQYERKHRSVTSHTCPDQGLNLQPKYVP